MKGFQKGHATSLRTRKKIGDANRTSFYVACAFCQNPVLTKPSKAAKNNRVYCSRECYSNYRKYIMPPEEQNSYGTGHSPAERKHRRDARSTLNHAIRAGLIQRQPCSICGAIAEAHHDDYGKPLDVKWLCFAHHRAYHNNPELNE